MIESWREVLYPFGFIAQLVFGVRFLQQWLVSERKQESVVTRWFWVLSLIGNLLLLVHSVVQLQIHVSLIQACNAVISWRNLNLMQAKEQQWSFRGVLSLFGLSVLSVVALFILQSTLFTDSAYSWFRTPTWLYTPEQLTPMLWHSLGAIAMILFSSRFWVQWWEAERSCNSQLNSSFWWLSLVGGVLSVLYFFQIGDLVNMIGPAIGLVPYTRNLMLIYKKNRSSPEVV